MDALPGFLLLVFLLGVLPLVIIGYFLWRAGVTIWNSPSRIGALLLFLAALVVFALWFTRNIR